MSLPPSVLLVKRKRDDGPIESLYIETSSRDSPKRRHTESAFVFRRLQQQAGVADTDVTRQAPNSASRTEVRSPSPSISGQISQSSFAKDARPKATKPRRFLLSRETLRDPPIITRKRKSSQYGPNIALFVESRELATVRVAHQELTDREHTKSAGVPPSPARKRPTQKAHKVERPGDNGTQISEAQSRTMQQHASQLDSYTEPSSDDQGLTNKADSGFDAMDVDEDYIVDTYVRHAKDEEERYDIHDSRQRKGEEGSIGYLVIPEADQTLWETYYDSDADSEDEQDWDSEQDDENAENYYGADYPEDEVDSEDEFGEAPYRFHKGSDEEEYGSGDEAWSDHEEASGVMSWTDVTKMKPT